MLEPKHALRLAELDGGCYPSEGNREHFKPCREVPFQLSSKHHFSQVDAWNVCAATSPLALPRLQKSRQVEDHYLALMEESFLFFCNDKQDLCATALCAVLDAILGVFGQKHAL